MRCRVGFWVPSPLVLLSTAVLASCGARGPTPTPVVPTESGDVDEADLVVIEDDPSQPRHQLDARLDCRLEGDAARLADEIDRGLDVAAPRTVHWSIAFVHRGQRLAFRREAHRGGWVVESVYRWRERWREHPFALNLSRPARLSVASLAAMRNQLLAWLPRTADLDCWSLEAPPPRPPPRRRRRDDGVLRQVADARSR
jgi:hypothetical protein